MVCKYIDIFAIIEYQTIKSLPKMNMLKKIFFSCCHLFGYYEKKYFLKKNPADFSILRSEIFFKISETQQYLKSNKSLYEKKFGYTVCILFCGQFNSLLTNFY